jgi:diguanylate cyclase (GGDEF)-like protein
VLFDLDGFKLVNDVSGHAEGDRVLRAVAHELSAAGRTSDLAFRVGGDELALVLPDTGPEEAAQVAARAAAMIGEVDSRTSVSYGVGAWPDHGPTKTTLLRTADEQLYAMKHSRVTTPLATRGVVERGGPDDQRERLAIASRLSSRLAALDDEREIVQVTVDELDRTFGYFLAVVHRLDRHDDTLRLVAVAGELATALDGIGQWAQPVEAGVLGRVVRTGEPMIVHDTRLDPDFVTPDERVESRSELALPIRVAGEIWGVLNLEAAETGAFGEDDLLLATMIAAQVGAAIHRSRLSHDREDTFMTALGVLCDALETKDSYTAAHAREVADLCEQVAARLGVRGEELRNLSYAALLHDIGKIGVRSEILRKPGPLEDYEFEEIKLHTVIGADMLSRIPAFAGVQSLVRSAHERWDGHGYPDGLRGDEIPLGARVICACDAFHAMTSDRPYRDAMPIPAAIAELRTGAGRQFDPAVVEALIAEIAALAPT